MTFLDTNIILRYLTRDNEAKAQACFALFQRVVEGKETLITTEVVIAEVAYVLASAKNYHLSREDIRARLLPILILRGLHVAQKQVCLRALEIFASSAKLDFEDAFSIAFMEREKVLDIYSYDTDFDRFSHITRQEPEVPAQEEGRAT
jgi:predicted nucleic acid-binding protein